MAAKRGSDDARVAMGELCRAYWYPLYAYVRRNGFAAEEAEDITQAFFSRFLEKDLLDGVAPEKGRFRSFLLVCMKRFVANWRESAAALKRGGGKPVISVDLRDAEDRYRCEPAHDVTPERIFERRWTLTLLERALAVVAEEYAQKGKTHLLEALKEHLVAQASALPFGEIAQRLGITESAARAAAHRLRQHYRAALEGEIAATLADEADLDDEIRSVMAAVSG